MGRYIIRRLVSMLPVILLVSVIIFMIIHLTPGDPVLIMLGEEATQETVTALRRELGLDQPLPLQYVTWLGRVVQGDLGRSIRTRQPVTEAIVERLPPTIQLTLLALTVSLLIALPAGIASATRRGSALDVVSTVGALMGQAIPNFFLAVLLIFVFAYKLRWFPPIGYVPPWEDLGANLKGMVLPAITLGAAAAASTTRLTRSSLLEVMNQDYIRTARAKGVDDRTVISYHALKNALIPVVTIVGLQLGGLLSGSVITETIFSLPGVGKLVVDSIFSRDFPMTQGVVLFLSLVFLFTNLVVDVLYAFIDPRIHYG
jgi:peptide/nickel transport system permease protein